MQEHGIVTGESNDRSIDRYNDRSQENMMQLIKAAKSGDREAKSRLVDKNAGLVWSIVRRFQNRGQEAEDLFQIGCIGLIKSINKFDTSFDVKFSTYAVPMIMGEIKRFLRDDGIIKVSRSIKEMSNKVRAVKEIMAKEMGKEPTLSELSSRTGIAVEDLVMAVEASYAPESIYSPAGEGDNSQMMLIDKLNDECNENETDLIDRLALSQVLETLGPREKQIIMLRFFKDKTQVQIAKILGISQVQVSRMEKRILQELRQKINA